MDIHFVMGTLGGHFLTGRAVTPNKFILTINRNKLIYRDFIVNIAVIFAFNRHALIVCTIFQEFMRSPRPVSRSLVHMLLTTYRSKFITSNIAVIRNTRLHRNINTNS